MSMVRTGWPVAVVLLVAGSTLPAEVVVSEVPNVVYADGTTTASKRTATELPRWVVRSWSVEENRFSNRFVSPAMARHLEQSAKSFEGISPEDDPECRKAIGPLTGGRPAILASPSEAPRSISDVVAQADGIFGVRVAEVASGLVDGYPGSLLRVSVEEVLLPSGKLTEDDTAFVAMLTGSYIVPSGQRLCMYTGYVKTVFEVGDEQVLFLTHAMNVGSGVLFVPPSNVAVVERETGQILVAPRLDRGSLSTQSDSDPLNVVRDWVMGVHE